MKNIFSYPFSLGTRQQTWFVFLLGAVFFIPFIGHVHLFDWDEINFAESSREMLTSGDWFHVQINYEPFWEKPPLFFWLQSASMRVFGVNEFAARFPDALCGMITLLVLFRIGTRHHGNGFGLTWALVYAGSMLPHMYFKSGIIDPVFNLFIFLSVYQLAVYLKEQHARYAWMAGMFCGLAILTKGPVGLLLVLLTYCTYLCFTRFKNIGKPLHILYFIVVCACISLLWVLPEILAHGISILGDFIAYQYELLTEGVAGHEQPFYYHFVVVFVGCFPMSVLALFSFRFSAHPDAWNLARWMKILFWVVLILFTIVKTKIVHYSSMCWLPLSYLAARQLADTESLKKGLRILYVSLGVVLGLVIALLPVFMMYKESWMYNVKDAFARACLTLPVEWMWSDMMAGIFLMAGTIIAFILLVKKQVHTFVVFHAVLVFTVLLSLLLTVVPKIETYSQRPAIEFYESLRGKDVYVLPVGFKSYAHQYYFQVPDTENENRRNEDFLFYGNVDKPVYFVTKYNNDFLDQKTGWAEKIAEKGGFKFYKRKPAR